MATWSTMRRRRSNWRLRYAWAYFLTPEGECFHNATVTGGKAASEGPLALKRDLRETETKLARVQDSLSQAEAQAAALTRSH